MAADLVQSNHEIGSRWLKITLGIAVAAILSVSAAKINFSPLPHLQAITTDEDTRDTLDDYKANLDRSEILLVGSSLMYRIRQGYFGIGSRTIRNVAIAGDSPETGLRIVAEQNTLPKLIIVETNVLERKPNLSLIKEYAPSALSFGHFIARERPIRTILALKYGWTSQWLDEYERKSALELLSTPPRPQTPAPGGTVQGWSIVRNQRQMYDTAVSLSEIAANLRKRGVEVCFIYLPMSPEIEQSPLAVLGREIFNSVSSLDDRPLQLDIDRTDLRWSDGQHLDARSAALVARAIARRFRLL